MTTINNAIEKSVNIQQSLLTDISKIAGLRGTCDLNIHLSNNRNIHLEFCLYEYQIGEISSTLNLPNIEIIVNLDEDKFYLLDEFAEMCGEQIAEADNIIDEARRELATDETGVPYWEEVA